MSVAAILSMKYIGEKAHESKDIKPIVTLLMDKFKERYASHMCDVVKPRSFAPGIRCLAAVETTCDILEEVISEYDRSLRG